MIKLVKDQLYIYKKDYLLLFIFTIGVFIFGGIVGFIINTVEPSTSYAAVGMMFTCILTPFLVLFYLGAIFYVGFDTAIKMGRTRKSYLLIAVINMYIICILFFVGLFILNLVDKLIYNLAFKELSYKIDFLKSLDLIKIINLIIISVSLTIFITALFHRLGIVMIFVLGFGMSLISVLPLVLIKLDMIHLLSFLEPVAKFFTTTSLNNLMVMSTLVSLILFLVGILIMSKESVKI